MTTTQRQIAEMEESLRQAELASNASFFEDVIADDAVIFSPEGPVSFGKAALIKLHQPAGGPRFTRVEAAALHIVDHGPAAVVTCRRVYEGPTFTGTLTFLRMWVRKRDRWQIVAASLGN